MDTAGNQSGFPPHVWNQLHEMAQSAPHARGGRGRNRGRGRVRGQSQGQGQGQTGAGRPHQGQAEQDRLHSQQHAASFTANLESFPPLGAQPPPRGRGEAPHHSRPQYQPGPQFQNFNDPSRGSPREYQERARGSYRGSRSFDTPQLRPPHPGQSEQQPQLMNPVAFHSNGRPQTNHHRQLYNPNDGMHFNAGQQQRSTKHLVLLQAEYLASVGKKAYAAHKFSQEERDVKESFRRTLESIAKQALGAEYPNLQQNQVKLKCYGSLANGFALTGCDMDLLLSLPGSEGSGTAVNLKPSSDTQMAAEDGVQEQVFKIDTGRILEKAFLDHDFGARLITQTRVPILRICQNPTPELLRNLRENRAAREDGHGESDVAESKLPTSDDPSTDIESAEQALTDLNLGETASAKQGRRGNAGLEFTEDCGIQCDINFSNFVALYNSDLLRSYQSFDPRVREVGVFVKIWAKTRDINTPYRGTLSSYGWIIMVLHYLMNIARPPVIPNLQHLAKLDDAWHPDRPVELFEGFDVRFVQDPQSLKEIREDMAASPNRESTGQLLRGLFQYYATHQGFHWTRDVISIRTKGGLMSKQAKGWTEAKWQQTQTKSVRLRYLLAIEDPFEIEHNIARTVGHHGIITIRNEFRRAWSIISTIGTDHEIPAEELLTPVTSRVDTLRQDLEARRERQIKMRKELEAKEKALLRKRDEEFPESLRDGTLGNSDPGNPETRLFGESQRWPSTSKLTSTPYPQNRNPQLKPKSRRIRKVLVESDDEEDSSSPAPDNAKEQECLDVATPPVQAKSEDDFPSISDILLTHGYDDEGNPVAWDIETQDGRWLHWRDGKAKRGELRPFSNPNLRKLNEQCPYDPRRPSPYDGMPYRNNAQRYRYLLPPWPSSNRDGANMRRVTPTEPCSVEDKDPVSRDESGARTQDAPDADVKAEATEICETDTHEKNKFRSRENTDNTSGHRDPSGSVGPNIPWDKRTIGGRWLRQRDARIRAGAWEYHPGSRGAEIDLAFPYDPEMTWKELEAMNQLLRQNYMRTLLRTKQDNASRRRVVTDSSGTEVNDPAPPPGVCRTAASAMQTESSARTDPSPAKPPSRDSHPFYGSISESAPITPPTDARSPDLAFLRTQRLSFFSKLVSPPTNDTEMAIRIEPKPAIASAALALVIKEFPTSTPPARILVEEVCVAEDYSHGLQADAYSGEADHQSHDADADDNELSASVAAGSEESPGTVISSLEIPATLFPHLDNSSRPRDEDPNILPIPQDSGFCFDPRQLEDLAVIARGGNGCARAGAQFHIEENYEWGGGGMMGWKPSSTSQRAGMSGNHTPHEAGTGDEEGLLAELPGDLD
ncbi:hypothetical protein AYL99_11152 [Fonsecaea erecta]|uniref:polynucleotide adenylyltransferase n=1 Tax=Fonsecaea erecta TaxID=1367422 RepID=A0A178Z4N1_9EURO|nr:hypothetical protein AYL99_11152 [Fonsecaea erecta]OAP54704.1 hypothetical protein AYL99_11152 [Fonsecaea erecta]